MLAARSRFPTVRYRAGVESTELERTQRMFADFALTTATRAPLYSRLSSGIAADAELAGLLALAPPTQRQPVLLFACVHALLLADPDDELAAWYPNLTTTPADDDPLPAFRRFCRRHRSELATLLARRSTQTNEIGRCALFLPALAMLESECGPLAHVDVGASAGLNLLLPHFGYRYEPGGQVGSTAGDQDRIPEELVLTCGTRGDVPVPDRVPDVAVSVGLDRNPISIADDDQARWLEACIWPDQRDRFQRLRAALALGRRVGLDVRTGDAVTDTPSVVEEVASTAHPVVTNSWVLNYFTKEHRVAYLEMLNGLGRRGDLSWLFAESPAQIEGLPVPEQDPDAEITVLSLVRWRDGQRRIDHLATCHPHGYWMHWGTEPSGA
jgi:hypothetical protein